MTEALRLLLALVLPTAAGTLLLARLWPPGQPGRLAAMVGYGYFLGMFLTVLILLAVQAVTGEWRYWPTILTLAALATAAALVNCRQIATPLAALRNLPAALAGHWRQASWAARIIGLLLGVLIAWRLSSLLLEVIWRPVYAWDAWYSWSYRARLFFETGTWPAALNQSQTWLKSPETVYSTGFRHPPPIYLVQSWPALALDRWHESLVNLPWWLAGAALPMAVYGQLRTIGVRILVALVAVYALLSLPYYGTHTALGGYADLWLAALFGLGAMSLFLMFQPGHWRQAILMLLAATAVAFTKQYGILYAVFFVPALLLAAIPARLASAIAVLTPALLAGIVFTVGIDIEIPFLGHLAAGPDGVTLPRGRSLSFDPPWGALAQRTVQDGTWHLLWFLLPPFLLVALASTWRQRSHRAVATLVAVSLIMALGAYLLTSESRYLVDGTGFNRHVLVIVPALIFWAAAWGGMRHAPKRPPKSALFNS